MFDRLDVKALQFDNKPAANSPVLVVVGTFGLVSPPRSVQYIPNLGRRQVRPGGEGSPLFS